MRITTPAKAKVKIAELIKAPIPNGIPYRNAAKIMVAIPWMISPIDTRLDLEIAANNKEGQKAIVAINAFKQTDSWKNIQEFSSKVVIYIDSNCFFIIYRK